MNALKGLTKDLTGSSDICRIVPSSDFKSLKAHAYLLAPQDEEILFAFESAKDEFAFTNQALICVSGDTATTSRRLVTRHEFRDQLISNVKFETTGRIDRDCEIKFLIGADQKISIDIARKEEDQAKGFYRVLLLLARKQGENRKLWEHAQLGLERSVQAVKLQPKQDMKNSLTGQANETMQWLMSDFEKFNPRCYRDTIVQALQQQKNP